MHTSDTSPQFRNLAKIVSSLLIIGILSGVLTACGSSEPRSVVQSIKQGEVIVGTKFDQPGLGMRTPTKDMVGIDPDVLRFVIDYIADKHSLPTPDITWKETPSVQRETLINNGEVDMIAATYSINAGRLNAVDFAGPYLETHQGLLIREDATDVRSLQDLNKGKKLCSISGSTPAQNIKNRLPGVQLQEFDTYSSCVEALHQGKIDAVTTDEVILYGYAKQYDGEFSVMPLKNEDNSYWTNEFYGIGLAKGNDSDVQEINEALNAMHSSGEFNSIVRKNLDTDAIDTRNPGVGDLSFAQVSEGGAK